MGNKLGAGRSRESVVRDTAIGFVVGMMIGGLFDVLTGDIGIGTILGMVFGSLLGYFGLQNFNLMEYPPGVMLRVAIAGVLFFTVLFGTFYLLDRAANPVLLSLLPFAPLIPGLLLIAAIGYAFSRLDELQRSIQLQVIAIGSGITAIVSLTYGLWGLAGGDQANWVLVSVLLVFSWLVGKHWTRWKYR